MTGWIWLQATLAMQVVQEMPGHSTIRLIFDTYSYVIHCIQKEVANMISHIVT
jgi:hypothetical protein